MKDINLLPDWYHHSRGVENKMLLRSGALCTVVSIVIVLAIAIAFKGPLGADGGMAKQMNSESFKIQPASQTLTPTDNQNEIISEMTDKQDISRYFTDPKYRQPESFQMGYLTVDTKDSGKD